MQSGTFRIIGVDGYAEISERLSMNNIVEADLLRAVDRFLDETGMKPTIFGKKALGDGNLVAQLREGRELRSSTRGRVLSFIGAVSKRAPDVSCLSEQSGGAESGIQVCDSIPSNPDSHTVRGGSSARVKRNRMARISEGSEK